MKITNEWLETKGACRKGKNWFENQTESDGVGILRKLMLEKHYDWANWLSVRVMERKQYLAYAIYAAEQVLGIFEKTYPEDKRPRKAINAAKKVLFEDTPENKKMAAAYAAADADADADAAAAYAAAYAAYAAARAAYDKIDLCKLADVAVKIIKQGVIK